MPSMICNRLLFMRENTAVVSNSPLCFPSQLLCKIKKAFLTFTFFHNPFNVISGHYYSYVRPDIRRNEWLRFDDDIVTPVEYSDVVADAYGGSRRRRRKRTRSDSLESTAVTTPVKRRRGLFSRIFSMFGGLFRRATMIGSSSSSVGGCGFGYGGRASSAYMLQYARRSDMPKLYLEDHEQ